VSVDRLFVYGSLQPGGSNAHMLSGLSGTWTRGSVRGQLVTLRAGDAVGYPALILDDAAPPVSGHVFTSPGLSRHWRALDAFEGQSYARVIASVALATGQTTRAFVYALKP